MKPPIDGDDELRRGRGDEQRRAAGDHVDAGGDHRRGVDQGADRRRAFHRVGQPDVQRELGALAAGPEQQQQADRRGDAAGGIVVGGDARFAKDAADDFGRSTLAGSRSGDPAVSASARH